MELRKIWEHLTLLFLWFIIFCGSQNIEIQHLNTKVNRLNRITNGLQKDVDDIWLALSNTAMISGNLTQVCNETQKEKKTIDDILKTVNTTVSEVHKLKTEIERVLYAEKGLRKEKALNREALIKMKRSQNDFKAKLNVEIIEMKSWLQNFEGKQTKILAETLKNMKFKCEEDNRILQENIQNITKEFLVKLEENNIKTQTCYDKLQEVAQSVNETEKHTLNEINAVKNKINEKLSLTAACQEEWKSFGGHCYFFSPDKMTWDEAQDFCRSRNSHIVQTNNEAEIAFIVLNCKAYYSVWTGANDLDTEGNFLWYNTTKSVPHDYFYPSEPNNSRGSEDCAELYCQTSRVSKLNDVNCARQKNFVCEQSKTIFQ